MVVKFLSHLTTPPPGPVALRAAGRRRYMPAGPGTGRPGGGGAARSATRTGDAVMPEPPADLTPLQLVLQSTGLTVKLDRPVLVVGRHSSADVRLRLPDVSRFHCRFEFEGGA